MSTGNILLLNLNHIGDILFTTPAIRALREKYPDAKITAVVLAGMEELLKHNPFVDEVLTRRRGLIPILKLVPKLRSRKIGTSLLFTFSSVRMSALGWMSGASTRVGFDDPGIARFLTHPVPRVPGRHRVDWYLDLARAVGADVDEPHMEMFTSTEDQEYADDLLASAGITGDKPVAAISPGSSVFAKQWFPERYAALADKLSADGVDVVIVGAPSERETVEDVKQSAKYAIADLAGKTKIGQLAAVLARCNAVVSNDTGPMHLAVSVGTPVVAIFGPTDPRETGPYCRKSKVLWEHLDCGPCGHKPTCSNRDCLQAITVNRVYEEAVKLIPFHR
ncbi:MAG TPA: lipopolysaccharide heptosyltransferase II [Armatimonadota bacterium]|nr:lipopolysaccharide heptosyltransferase II [Armatimonadota bacterium]